MRPAAYLALAALLVSCADNRREEYAGHGLSGADAGAALPAGAVVSAQRTVTVKPDSAAEEVALEGYVVPDERRAVKLAVRFGGRLEKLYVKYPWQRITAGEKLMDIYSPELNRHVEEYIHLLAQNDAKLARKAEEKLLLLGLTESQVKELKALQEAPFTFSVLSPHTGYVLPGDPVSGDAAAAPAAVPSGGGMAGMDMSGGAGSQPAAPAGAGLGWPREGMYVSRDQTLFVVNDLDKVWGLAMGSASLPGRIRPGMKASILSEQHQSRPRQAGTEATVDFIEPVYEKGQKFTRIRFYINNPGHALQINSLFRAVMMLHRDSAVALPASAVLDLGKRCIVWVRTGQTQAGKGIFEWREVIAAAPNNGLVQVLSGLAPGEVVAEQAGMMLDSETIVGESWKLKVESWKLPAPNNHSGGDAEDGHTGEVYYTCPMHPSVVSDRPGVCPVCNMTLVQKTKPAAGHASAHADMLHLTGDQLRMAGIRTAPARTGRIARTVTLTGTVVTDETGVFTIAARAKGRIEKLHVSNPGQHIGKGQLLLELYSERLLADETDHIRMLQQLEGGGAEREMLESLIEASRKKLLLWGLSKAHIGELEKRGVPSPYIAFHSEVSGTLKELRVREGQYVEEGDALFLAADLGTVWVEAQLYAGETEALRNSPEVLLSFEQLPGQTFVGRIVFLPPQLGENSKISRLRIAVHNPSGSLRPGMMSYVQLSTGAGTALLVPNSALLQENMRTVWVEKEKGMYERRMVRTGIEGQYETEITEGLQEGETVVVAGAYLLSSELILRRGAAMKHVH